jgi:hypothetical protein
MVVGDRQASSAKWEAFVVRYLEIERMLPRLLMRVKTVKTLRDSPGALNGQSQTGRPWQSEPGPEHPVIREIHFGVGVR